MSNENICRLSKYMRDELLRKREGGGALYLYRASLFYTSKKCLICSLNEIRQYKGVCANLDFLM